MTQQYCLETTLIQMFKERGIDASNPQRGVITVQLNHEVRQCNLFNLQMEIQRYPMFRAQLLHRFVEQVLQPIASTKSNIYPRLLPRQSQKPVGYPWVEPLDGMNLDVAMIEHDAGILRFCSPVDIVKQGGLQSLKKQAVHNMLQFVQDLEWQCVSKGVFVSKHPEVLTSSALLCLSEMASLPLEASSIQYCAVPSRGILWIGTDTLDDRSPQILNQYQTEPHPISSEIFLWNIESSRNWVQSWVGQC